MGSGALFPAWMMLSMAQAQTRPKAIGDVEYGIDVEALRYLRSVRYVAAFFHSDLSESAEIPMAVKELC